MQYKNIQIYLWFLGYSRRIYVLIKFSLTAQRLFYFYSNLLPSSGEDI